MSLHPYALLVTSWVIVGICTGIANYYSYLRVPFLAFAFLIISLVWEYIDFYKERAFAVIRDKPWAKITLRICSYSKPFFYLWLATLVQHLLWWNSGYVTLEDNQILIGWLQSFFILILTAVSYFGFVSKSPPFRACLQYGILISGVLLPQYRKPWFEEPIILLQTRCLVMLILFAIQCFESYALTNFEKRNLISLFYIRIAWVVMVHPLLLLFAIVSLLYYVFTMIRIRFEAVLPTYEIAKPQPPVVLQPAPVQFYQDPSGIANMTSEEERALFVLPDTTELNSTYYNNTYYNNY